MGEILLLEPIGGIAGDMFLAAALDLGVPLDAVESALATLGVGGFRLEVTRAEAGGLHGTHVAVVAEGAHLEHRGLREILAVIARSRLSAKAKQVATEVFRRIGAAEAAVHRVALDDVHFHEVGAVDSIVDVCGAAVVLDLLGDPRVVSAPPELGQGYVETAHGRLPVPPPAVLEILKGIPVRPGGPPGEAVTPTGAAILAVVAQVGDAPVLVPRKVGIGVGTARWPDRPNVLRMTLADAAPAHAAGGGGAGTAGVVLVECNLDDCPGQLVARGIEAALEAGALDAWASPCTMKKGRPGLVLAALAPASRRDAVARSFITETTTLGVRFRPMERLELDRELVEVETEYGKVRVKVGRLDGEVLVAHPEYDDCLAAARLHGVPVKEVMSSALVAWRR